MKLRELWNDWLMDKVREREEGDYVTDDEETGQKKVKPPSKEEVVGWIEDAWNSISENVVVHAFKCTGISNSMDGDEDDLNTVDLNRPII